MKAQQKEMTHRKGLRIVSKVILCWLEGSSIRSTQKETFVFEFVNKSQKSFPFEALALLSANKRTRCVLTFTKVLLNICSTSFASRNYWLTMKVKRANIYIYRRLFASIKQMIGRNNLITIKGNQVKERR